MLLKRAMAGEAMGPTAAAATAQRLASISFSGAGFLGCYHMGAAACLLGQGYLLRPGDCASSSESSSAPSTSTSESYPALVAPPILTGVSAGSIVSAAISAGVRPDAGMETILEISKRTREKGGTLDIIRPGFSLVDQVEDLLLMNMKRALGGTGETADDYDRDLFLRRIQGGRMLRIGLTDKREFRPNGLVRDIPRAYRYVDQFRDVEDAVAACILSSYIPGVTGTLRGATCPMNTSVRDAWNRVAEMETLGFVKDNTGKPVGISSSSKHEADNASGELYYWDGGIADVFPTIDDSTIIVSPINGKYTQPSISPKMPDWMDDTTNSVDADQISMSSNGNTRKRDDSFTADLIMKRALSYFPQTVQAHADASLGINTHNAETLFRMLWSSDDKILEERFASGFDDAKRFLRERDLLTTYRN